MDVNYECLEEALMFCIRASNKEVKEVAMALWPTDRPETSYCRLIDCLNPSKRHKLNMDEIIFIMNFCGRYDPLYYMADKCLHTRPEKKCIDKELKEKIEKFDDLLSKAMKDYQHILKISEQRGEVDKIRKGSISFLDLEKRSA